MINNKINNFSNVGYSVIRGSFDKQKIKVLKKTIKSITPKTKHIFYSSKENFKKHARFQRITPGIYDHNILLDKRVNLEFIEKNKKFVSLITNLFKSSRKIWQLMNKIITKDKFMKSIYKKIIYAIFVTSLFSVIVAVVKYSHNYIENNPEKYLPAQK